MSRRCLTFVKGRHTYLFRYAEGDETALLDEFVRLAESPETDFEWLDAAMLCVQLDLDNLSAEVRDELFRPRGSAGLTPRN